MKKKYFDNIRTVLNSLLDYAVDEEYIEVNRFRSIRLNSHFYKPIAFKEENEEAFTRQEQDLVMREAERGYQVGLPVHQPDGRRKEAETPQARAQTHIVTCVRGFEASPTTPGNRTTKGVFAISLFNCSRMQDASVITIIKLDT